MTEDDNIEDANFEDVFEKETDNKLKDERKAHYTRIIEADLQILLKNAATIRKTITDAKTSIKKNFYKKKFEKITAQVKHHVNALQHLEAMTQSEGSENDIIPNTIPTT